MKKGLKNPLIELSKYRTVLDRFSKIEALVNDLRNQEGVFDNLIIRVELDIRNANEKNRVCISKTQKAAHKIINENLDCMRNYLSQIKLMRAQNKTLIENLCQIR
jgi:hypothetical protein